MVTQMSKIKHVDELNNDEFESFVEQLKNGGIKKKFEITEKIDGQNLSFGLDEFGKMYTKTKNSEPNYQSFEYKKIPYLEGFKELHNDLSKNKDILEGIQNHIEKELDDKNFYIQIFSELLYYDRTNLIKYKEGKKVYFIEVVLIDSNTPDNQDVLDSNTINTDSNIVDYIIKKLNRIENWEFKKLPVIDVNNDIDVELNYSGQLTNEDKCNWKKKIIYQILNRDDNKEGLVFRNKDTNKRYKLVDKDRFSEQNKKSQKTASDIKQLNRWLNNKIRKKVLSNSDIVSDFKKLKEKLADYLLLIKHASGQEKFYNLQSILEVISEDVMDEVDVSLDEEYINKLYNKYTDKLENIQIEYEKKLKKEQSKLVKKVSEFKIKNAYEKIYPLRKLSFGFNNKSDKKVVMSLLKVVLYGYKLEKIKEEFLNN